MAHSPLRNFKESLNSNNDSSNHWKEVADQYHRVGELADSFIRILDKTIESLNNHNKNTNVLIDKYKNETIKVLKKI